MIENIRNDGPYKFNWWDDLRLHIKIITAISNSLICAYRIFNSKGEEFIVLTIIILMVVFNAMVALFSQQLLVAHFCVSTQQTLMLIMHNCVIKHLTD